MAHPIVKRFKLALGKYPWLLLVMPAIGCVAGGVLASQPNGDPSFKMLGILSYRQQAVSFSQTGSDILRQGQTLTEEVLLANDVIEGVAAGIRVGPDEVARKARVKFVQPNEEKDPGASPYIEVSYTDNNPRRAKVAVDLLMTLMEEKSRQQNVARLQLIVNAVKDRLPDVTTDLRQAERRLENFDRVEGAAILAVQNGSLVGAITNSQRQQRQLRLQLEGIGAQIGSLEQRLGLSVDEAYVSSALSADPTVQQLRRQLDQLESERTIQGKRLRDQHPVMRDLERQKETFEELLTARAQEVLGGTGRVRPLAPGVPVQINSNLDPARQRLANALVELQTQRETVQQQLQTAIRSEKELRLRYQTIPNKQLERDRLAQQVALKKALHDQMQRKLVDADAAEAETVSSLALARPAQLKSKTLPESPSLILLLVAGLGGGLVGALAIIAVLGILDGRFQAVPELVASFTEREVAIAGTLPDLVLPNWPQDILPVLVEPSPYGEAYEQFRSQLRQLNDKLSVVLVASLDSQEGKSVVAYNLAIASARAGKRTLLLELGLRSPSNSRALRVGLDPEALEEPLQYYSNLSNCVRLVPDVENLYMIPCPGPQLNPAAIIESSEMRQLIADARQRFDFVVVDSTALTACNDTLLLEPLTDGLLLVGRPGLTVKSRFNSALDVMTDEDQLSMRLIAGVINGSENVESYEAVDPDLDVVDDELLDPDDLEVLEAARAAKKRKSMSDLSSPDWDRPTAAAEEPKDERLLPEDAVLR
ncbi:MAG: lipopolysaccharide biosynthesis [Cyanobacteria bacterium P01_D01_bin.73]